MSVRLVGDVRQLNAKLKKLQSRVIQKAVPEVREALVSSTIQRFNRQRDPDDRPWQPLAYATVAPRAKDYKKTRWLEKRCGRKTETAKNTYP